MKRSKYALITGGTSGIGLGVALILCRDYDVALAYKSNDERATRAKKMVEAIIPPGGRTLTYRQPLTEYCDAQALLAALRRDFGRGPDVLVHSAGDFHGKNLLVRSEFSKITETINLHLTMSIALAKAVLPDMYDAGFGRIVNFSSTSVAFPVKGHPCDYVAAKAGVEGFSRSLALEVAHRGVTVNVVAPGFVETPMTEATFKMWRAAGGLPRNQFPSGSPATVQEIGKLVQLLCSEDGRSITGEVIQIDGGGRFCGAKESPNGAR